MKDINFSEDPLIKDAITTLTKTLMVRRKVICDMISIDETLFTKDKAVQASDETLKARLSLFLKVVTYLSSLDLKPEVILYAIKYSVIDEEGFPGQSAMETLRKLNPASEIDFDTIKSSLDSGIEYYNSLQC